MRSGLPSAFAPVHHPIIPKADKYLSSLTIEYTATVNAT
jgi:hypothetical protein